MFDLVCSGVGMEDLRPAIRSRAVSIQNNEFSLHFIPLNREGLIKFEKFLNKNEYNSSDDLTHDYMLKWVNKHKINKNDFIVEEHINYYTDINFFSIYNGDEVNIFFEKYELNQQTNKTSSSQHSARTPTRLRSRLANIRPAVYHCSGHSG